MRDEKEMGTTTYRRPHLLFSDASPDEVRLPFSPGRCASPRERRAHVAVAHHGAEGGDGVGAALDAPVGFLARVEPDRPDHGVVAAHGGERLLDPAPLV